MASIFWINLNRFDKEINKVRSLEVGDVLCEKVSLYENIYPGSNEL